MISRGSVLEQRGPMGVLSKLRPDNLSGLSFFCMARIVDSPAADA
jgi:hypothetical protein